MNRLLRAVTLGTILICTSGPAISQAQLPADIPSPIDISYVPPRSAMFLPIHDRLKNRRLLEAVQQFFTPYRLPRKLRVQVNECDGLPNAYYRSETVEICYELLQRIERTASDNSSFGSTRDDAFYGTFLQILFQKISLGLFDILQIPMFSSGGGAADQLAAFITLQVPTAAARKTLFGLASFHESLLARADGVTDADRSLARSIEDALCIAYGADPQGFSAVVQRRVLPQDRSVGCAEEYQRVRFAYTQLILPYVDRDLMRRVQEAPWLIDEGGGVRDPDARIVPMLFATTRVVRGSGANSVFTNDRSPEMTFGALRVRVPEGHTVGNVERPWVVGLLGWTLYRQRENDQKHFVLRATTHFDRSTFVQSVRKAGKNQALIFVHGFNNTFEDAAYRLAQIAFDTQFQGIPVLFSWPAEGSPSSYIRDISSARYSSDSFLELLQLMQGDSQLDAIHVIAHSMGNEVVLDALAKGNNALKAPLAEVVLAAPDVDRDLFIKQAVKITQVARGVTVYASSADRAMMVSRVLAAGAPRAGDVLPPPLGPVVLPGIDTIDVTALGDELFGWEHNAFAAKRILIGEIARLLSKGVRPVNARSPEIHGVPAGAVPPKYWWYPP